MQENGLKQLLLMSLALSTWYTFNAFSQQHWGNFSQLMYILPILFTGYGIFCFWRQHRQVTVEVLFGVFLLLGMALSFIPETWSTQPVWLLQDASYFLSFLALLLTIIGHSHIGFIRELPAASWVLLTAGSFVYFVIIPAALDPQVYAGWLSSLWYYVVGDTTLLLLAIYVFKNSASSNHHPLGWLLITGGWWLADSLELISYYHPNAWLHTLNQWLTLLPCAFYVWLAKAPAPSSRSRLPIPTETKTMITIQLLFVVMLHTLGYAFNLFSLSLLPMRSAWVAVMCLGFSYLLIKQNRPQPASPNQTAPIAEPPNCQIKAAIRQHLNDAHFNPKRLAAALGISERTLQRQCRDKYRQSPSALIKQMRLEEAAVQLARGQKPSVVAYQVGFNSISYFSRSFREYFGAPPSQYRQTLLEREV